MTPATLAWSRMRPTTIRSFVYLESEALTPIIQGLIAESSRPLAAIETDFAVDSTGFGTSQFFRYFSEKYGAKGSGERVEHDWLKCPRHGRRQDQRRDGRRHHRSQGPRRTAVRTARPSTAERFTIAEVSADKAYSSRASPGRRRWSRRNAVSPIHAPTRSAPLSAHRCWNKLFHYFSLQREEFVAHYHKRSQRRGDVLGYQEGFR